MENILVKSEKMLYNIAKATKGGRLCRKLSHGL